MNQVMEEAIKYLQNTGLIFSVFASGYSLYSILKDKPKVDVIIVEKEVDGDYIKFKLAFQNSGRKMTSATSFILHSEGKIFSGLQTIEAKIYPTGGHSISRPSPKYVEVYPLELPPGKACHFLVSYKANEEVLQKGKLEIKLINHKSIKKSLNQFS